MVLESSEPKENYKILKKNLFLHFGGYRAPLKPPFLGFWGVLGVPETPQNEEKNIFFKILSFSLGSELSRTIFIFDFQFQEVLLNFF